MPMAGLVIDIVMVDHCYSKPWSAHPDASNARPLKTVYMGKFPRGNGEDTKKIEIDTVIDVTSVQSKIPQYEVSKGRILMTESEKYVSSLKDDPEWEDQINKTGWSPQQNWLANKAIKVLHSDRLSRLAYENNINEPVLRKIHIDKTAKRFRQALASIGWETKLVKWLHGVLMENLGAQYLAAYLDVLQILKSKIPHLVERMIGQSTYNVRASNLGGEGVSNLIKRPWDPVLNAYSQNKMGKLPFNPLILVAPSGPTTSNSLQSKRMRYYAGQLSSLGKVIPVTMHTVNGGSGVSIAQCLEHMIGAVKTKVAELKGHFVNRPIVLMGWNIGALVSCQVALQESVSAVVCLGFPFTGVGGGRGDADDPLLESRTPTLFVIGQHASTCTIDEIEDIREKMKADNSLLVVGGADDHLRMSRSKKKQEGVTQIMVDKVILEEVSEFLGGILSQGPIIHESVIVDLSDIDYRKKKKHSANQLNKLDFSPVHRAGQGSSTNMTIANALRARGLSSTMSIDVQQKLGSTQTANMSAASSQMRVKRKYTKRKAVTKPVTAAPKKRFKSTPTPPVASPISSSIQMPFSAGIPATATSTPDLSGLFKTSAGLLPSFVLDDNNQKSALFTATKIPLSHAELASSKNYNLPSPALLGSSDEPLIAYKLEDSYKRFGQPADTSQPKPTISIEGLLQSPGPSFIGDVSSPLLNLGATRPQVHVTTAPTMASHIHQLLANISKSITAPTTTISLPSSYTPTKSTQLPKTDTALSTSLTPLQLNQSGSPLQNSVPTLMSSLNKTSGFNINNMIKIVTSTPLDVQEKKEPDNPRTNFAQKLQFTDLSSPLPTTESSKLPDLSADIMGSGLNTLEQLNNPAKPSGVPTPVSLTKTDEVFSHMISSIAAAKSSTKPDLSSRIVPTAGLEYPLPFSVLSQVGLPVSSYDQQVRLVSSSCSEETLGKVSSLLESSPVTERTTPSPRTDVSLAQRSHGVPGVNVTVVTGSGQKSSSVRNPNPTVTSYTATPKQSLATLAATRTRRIRTPKQFDL